MAHSGPRAGARDKQGGVTDAERVVDLYRRHAAAWALARGASSPNVAGWKLSADRTDRRDLVPRKLLGEQFGRMFL